MNTHDGARASHRRLLVLAAGLVVGFSIIVAQLIRYQVFRHAELWQMANVQRERERELMPERGDIFDSTGHPLAIDVVQWDISVSPPLVTDPGELADRLADLLDLPRDELFADLTRDQPWVQLARAVPQEIGEAILSLKQGGITCEPRPLRVYPEGELTAHAVGIVNDTGDGFYGVEGYYNPRLRGVQGKRAIEQDPAGGEIPVGGHAQLPAQAGTNVFLTLDRNIQMIAAQELKKALEEYEADSGTVVIMQPRTGAILALVSYPSFDPNGFADADPNLLADPSLSKIWEPGSIFKIVTWAGGLDSGTISPGTMWYDSGEIEVGGRIIQNWDRQGRGQVTMTDGLAQSLNTVAAFISTSMGKDTFYTYVRRFGFGSLSGVDLDSEGPGMIRLPGDPDWFPSDLGTNAFGQGIAVTPVQMLTAACAIANHGLMMKPYIVQAFVSDDRTIPVEPMAVRQVISADTAETLTEMMVEVVSREAKKAQVPGYLVAGKTGTAQVPTPYGYHPADTIASFIGFAPADDPKFAILVKLDRPQASPWANHTATPTFGAIAQRLLVYLQIPPNSIGVAESGQTP